MYFACTFICIHFLIYLLLIASAPLYKSFFGPGTTNATWSNVGGCRGTESSIFQCGFTTPVGCNNSYVAGVRCFGKDCCHKGHCRISMCHH